MYKATALFFISSFVCAESALRGSSDDHRKLASKTIAGECNLDNFASALGSSTLASYLKTSTNSAEMQPALAIKCAAALDPVM